ncbi:hypothetical protein JX265_011841 [Neoarthrinium moseri]|uniref:Succinate dehydrogenase subunit C n=2 Tax=Neoarthrinium moseri TaxID=1658444 RepID=A0A9P9WBB6_9PEZI|nr:hypothetical protein JX266_006705 [Neoarthrinium moseri]KAI1856126.1 hypothetical protein JX265_011841 [Neoarthrinium moseri]
MISSRVGVSALRQGESDLLFWVNWEVAAGDDGVWSTWVSTWSLAMRRRRREGSPGATHVMHRALTSISTPAAKKPNAAFFSQNLPRLALGMQTRPVTTTKYSESDAQSLLATQRKSRPVSPHLQIYDYSQTWFGASVWTRITGSIFSGGLYVFAASYLVAPLMGWHLESASLAAAFGALPVAVKGGLKFLLAWPFTFHSINGIRHLTYDFAKGFSKSTIKTVSNAIWASSLVAALGLAFYW